MATSGEATSAAGGGRGPLARWLASWRSAVRLARRDIRRHRGRALLVIALVGLPVLFVAAGATALATDDVTPVESVPRLMGSAQAVVSVPNGGDSERVQQGPYLDTYGGSGRAQRLPGMATDAPWTAQRLQRLTGGTVRTTYRATARAAVGDRRIATTLLGIDGRLPVASGRTALTSGRWPTSVDEVLVTPSGVAAGLPTTGALPVILPSGGTRTVAVVGVGTGWSTATQPAQLVALPQAVRSWAADPEPDFLVDRATPVTWDDVKDWNRYGLTVLSRHVVEHPDQALHEAEANGLVGPNPMMPIIVLVAVGILLETALLAGPAFAVGAARQRRSFALIASNGATAGQLRRYVLAQALVLGAAAALGGGVLGVVAGLAGIRLWSRMHADFAAGPLDVPWLQVVGVVTCAVLASLVAAYLPSRGVTRLDLIGALQGRGVTQRPVHAGWPLVGLVLAVVGGVVLAANLATHGREVGIAGGGVVLFAGAVMLVPWLLSMVGRLAGPMPLPLRMATRDTGRQRGRSAPAVAAIMASVTALTALSIGGFSDQAQGRRDYVPQTLLGQGVLQGSGPGWQGRASAVVSQVAPDLHVTPASVLGYTQMDAAAPPKAPATRLEVRAQALGCSRQQTLDPDHHDGPFRCRALGTSLFSDRSAIRVMSPEALARRMALTSAQRATLAGGGVLVRQDRGVVRDGRVTFLTGLGPAVDPWEDSNARVRPKGVVTLPAVGVDTDTFGRAFPDRTVGAVISPDTVHRLRWPTAADALDVTSAAGPVSTGAEQAISQRLDDTTNLYVERGYRSGSFLVFLVLFCVLGLLVLVATLVSTALSQAEGRADMATLAAVGATRALRRKVAAGQAFLVGLAGSLLGLVVGLVPGIAVTWPLTAVTVTDDGGTTAGGSPTIVIPWLPLTAVVLGVPVLAALVAAAVIRRAPQVTRRTG